MKRLIITFLTLIFWVSGCATLDFALTHNIVQTDYRSGVEYPQVQVFRSYKEIEAYSNSLAEGFQDLPNDHFTHDRSFVETLKRYNKDYFRENILIIATISAGSGGDRFAIDDITKTDDALTISIQKTKSGMTCDMAAWHILLELDSSCDTDSANIKVEIIE